MGPAMAAFFIKLIESKEWPRSPKPKSLFQASLPEKCINVPVIIRKDRTPEIKIICSRFFLSKKCFCRVEILYIRMGSETNAKAVICRMPRKASTANVSEIIVSAIAKFLLLYTKTKNDDKAITPNVILYQRKLGFVKDNFSKNGMD